MLRQPLVDVIEGWTVGHRPTLSGIKASYMPRSAMGLFYRSAQGVHAVFLEY